jgi:prepilin-type N-terminal cleavage/methylation domain-containing protein
MLLHNRQTNGVARRSLKRRGFTLVEVLVAVMLLGMMATGLASFTGYVGKTRLIGKQRSLALVVAQEAIEDARSHSFANTVPGTTTTSTTIGRFPMTVTTTIAINGPAMKVVQVSVKNTRNTELQRFTTTVFKETH